MKTWGMVVGAVILALPLLVGAFVPELSNMIMAAYLTTICIIAGGLTMISAAISED